MVFSQPPDTERPVLASDRSVVEHLQFNVREQEQEAVVQRETQPKGGSTTPAPSQTLLQQQAQLPPPTQTTATIRATSTMISVLR
jgi:hypothetical protein